MQAVGAVILVLVVIALILLFSSIKIVNEYERGVIFRLGRSQGAKGPGWFFIIPVLDKMVKTNLQIIAAPVASQSVITRDNVTCMVDAVAYFQVVDPAASVINVQNWYAASQLVAQTTLRSIVGRHELDQLLSERDRIDAELQIALDTQTEPWGVKVHRVEIRDVGLPEQMQRAMARQAEAERERRAKVIAAMGELEASQKLGEAAEVISRSPGALQLRQLQTMAEISAENNSTIIFPIPVEILEPFANAKSSLGSVAMARPAGASTAKNLADVLSAATADLSSDDDEDRPSEGDVDRPDDRPDEDSRPDVETDTSSAPPPPPPPGWGAPSTELDETGGSDNAFGGAT